MRSIPEELMKGPFTRERAEELHVTSRMLQAKRFVRLFPGVWRHVAHEMTEQDWVEAVRLALPPTARMTGITRLQRLGLDFGPTRPWHFVIQGDLHLALPNVFLHRTKLLAPTDDVGVTPAAAFLFYCSHARVIDAIQVGDWLLHNGHMSVAGVRDLALAAPWRDGAHEALWILEHLDERSRSLKESETRALLVFAGLPTPEVNFTLTLSGRELIVDLLFLPWRVAVEYEGKQHQEDRGQYTSDIGRYALFRRHNLAYVQATTEKIAQPRVLVREVYRELVDLGYEGAAPEFGDRWHQLFRPIREAVGSREDWLRAWGRGEVS
jgi:hypothetical protein